MSAPREFRLLTFGRQPLHDDRPELEAWTFDRAAGERVLAAQAGRPLVIDYEHQSLREYARADGLAPAAGWIGRLELRDDGLWATDVSWTQRAETLLAADEYRYFSPVLYWSDVVGGTLEALGPVALTNDPALRVPSLTAARRGEPDGTTTVSYAAPVLVSVCDMSGAGKGGPGPGSGGGRAAPAPGAPGVGDKENESMEEFRRKVAEALGLAADASEEEILARLAGGVASAMCHAYRGLATRLKIDVGDDVDEERLVTALERRSTAAAAEAARSEARIAALEQRVAESEFEVLCASGAGKGRITPAMRPAMKSLFRSDRTQFDSLLATLPVLVGEPELTPAGGGGAATAQDPYLTALARVREERKCTQLEAITIVRREQPAVYEAFRRRQMAVAAR
ncbi:MAG: phage protease [Phycisphaerae bacterium]|nr:hypothetical protein [Phycisphaerae bacterium]MCZ2398600.1 phage protease [Phycisphaerae bacterium]